MKHIVLLGDSIFDNAVYVAGGPDVRRQVQDLLSSGARATLLAQDGALTADVLQQLKRLPPHVSHLVLSAGGNDALQSAGVLQERVTSVAEAIDKVATVANHFEGEYERVLQALSGPKVPVAVCTIYDPRFPDPAYRRAASAALTVLNDRITRAAFRRGFTVLDLRLICDQDEDFANPIEPSMLGGGKIAKAINAFALGAAPSAGVFAGH